MSEEDHEALTGCYVAIIILIVVGLVIAYHFFWWIVGALALVLLFKVLKSLDQLSPPVLK